MRSNSTPVVVLVSDLGEPFDLLRERLSPAEQVIAQSFPTERRQRHFALGRLAARVGTRQVLADIGGFAIVEIVPGDRGEPVVLVDGRTDIVSVTIAHSGHAAAACAWPNARHAYSVGIDIEQIRDSDIAQNWLAFSPSERVLLGCLGPHRPLAGLAAWTAKEAAWKALRPHPSIGLAAVRLTALSLVGGSAVVAVRDGCKRQVAVLWVRLCLLNLAREHYVVALAVARRPLTRLRSEQGRWAMRAASGVLWPVGPAERDASGQESRATRGRIA